MIENCRYYSENPFICSNLRTIQGLAFSWRVRYTCVLAEYVKYFGRKNSNPINSLISMTILVTPITLFAAIKKNQTKLKLWTAIPLLNIISSSLIISVYYTNSTKEVNLKKFQSAEIVVIFYLLMDLIFVCSVLLEFRKYRKVSSPDYNVKHTSISKYFYLIFSTHFILSLTLALYAWPYSFGECKTEWNFIIYAIHVC